MSSQECPLPALLNAKGCDFVSWYNTFKRHTDKSTILDIPSAIWSYIKDAPLTMPQNATAVNKNQGECSDSDTNSWSDEEETTDAPHFPEFQKTVDDAIDALGGTVFPRLNWSSPKDAAWINFGNTMKCQNFSDILLLLKASDCVSYDMTTLEALQNDAKTDELHKHSHALVLKKWRDYRPEGEFRCFVKDKCLLAMCQRNRDAFFDFIHTKKTAIIEKVSAFFNTHVKGQFPLDCYTLDVYVTKQQTGYLSPVKIVDFNVYGFPTDALLFRWEELAATLGDSSSRPVFRYQEDKCLQPNMTNQYAIPIDLADIATGPSG